MLNDFVLSLKKIKDGLESTLFNHFVLCLRRNTRLPPHIIIQIWNDKTVNLFHFLPGNHENRELDVSSQPLRVKRSEDYEVLCKYFHCE